MNKLEKQAESLSGIVAKLMEVFRESEFHYKVYQAATDGLEDCLDEIADGEGTIDTSQLATFSYRVAAAAETCSELWSAIAFQAKVVNELLAPREGETEN